MIMNNHHELVEVKKHFRMRAVSCDIIQFVLLQSTGAVVHTIHTLTHCICVLGLSANVFMLTNLKLYNHSKHKGVYCFSGCLSSCHSKYSCSCRLPDSWHVWNQLLMFNLFVLIHGLRHLHGPWCTTISLFWGDFCVWLYSVSFYFVCADEGILATTTILLLVIVFLSICTGYVCWLTCIFNLCHVKRGHLDHWPWELQQ